MKPQHIIMAIFIAFSWGMNAPLVKLAVGLSEPFFFAVLRSALLGLLVVFFPKPRVSWPVVNAFALVHGAKISFLYYSLKIGLSAGISTVILQSQSIFTVLLSVLIFKEIVSRRAYYGLAVSFLGVAIIGLDLQSSGNFLGMIYVLIAAFLAAISFLLMRKRKNVHYMSFIGWFNMLSVLPFFIMAYVFEGMPSILHTLHNFSWYLLFIIFLSALTVIGAYAFMVYLLERYDASQVAPYLLLIPVFGLSGSYICLGEWCELRSLVGSMVVIAGLALNQSATKKAVSADKKHS